VKPEDYRANQGYFNIVAFGELAHELIKSGKGSQILVNGELRLQLWDNGERSGTTVEIEIADLVPLELVGSSI
jgi:single-strand DNA-binding protein